VDTSERDKTQEALPGRRILVISPWENRWSMGEGAGVSDDYHFIDKLTRSGYELHFVVPRGGAGNGPPVEGLRVHTYANFFRATARWPTPLKRLVWPFLFNIMVTPKAVSVGRAVRPIFVLGHSHYSSFACWVTRKRLGVPGGVKLFGVMDLVHTEWSKAKYYFKNIEQIAALKIPQDVWIILDDGTRGREAATRHGVPKERVRFLPNGIDVEWADLPRRPGPARDELEIPLGDTVVLFLARLVPSKRPELFLRAAKIVLAAARRPIVFVVAGDGPSRGECERLASDLALGRSVRFAGTVPHSKVPALMHASDVFVSTSSLTNAAIPTCEAMACGLPVVGLDVGNTKDVVLDGETGFAVPDGDVDALARAITRLADDETLRRRMGENSKRRAKEIFTGWDRRVEEEIRIIEDLVGTYARKQNGAAQ
jgi:glycosyltransferase involved in cell wall biosynthesis